VNPGEVRDDILGLDAYHISMRMELGPDKTVKGEKSMQRKTGLVTLLVSLAVLLSAPGGAQLQEAVTTPWPGFHVLEGRWRAQDGWRVIDIKKIYPTGRIEVEYSNPESVHVTQAQAARDGRVTRVQLVLRDADSSYTYDLTYDPGSDRLKGVYRQKTNTKGTEIIFLRMGPRP
jgi:hypothetical protein